jgi:hypothetical protein
MTPSAAVGLTSGAMAKSVEEQYDNDNVRLKRQTRVLISYKPGV